MGMYDSVYVTGLTCDSCGHTSIQMEVEVQFKAYVGRSYSSDLQVVHVGERLEGFPTIPVLDESGCWNCPKCDHFHESVRVRIERGIITSVTPIVRDDEGYPNPPMVCRPGSSNPEKIRRREAALSEVYRREIVSRAVVPLMPNTQYSTLASAMSVMLRRTLDYQGIARQLFVIEQLGTKHQGPYRKTPGGKWERVPRP